MNFAEQIARIQSAASDPRKLALAVLDIILASQPQELRRVLQAAAVLRWFDETVLAAVLDPDLRDGTSRWLELLKTLTAVERASGRNAWNVHETTRLALRGQLQGAEPARIAELAARAAAFFHGTAVPDRIESAYHLVLASPMRCGPALRVLEYDLRANPESALALAAALGEYLGHDDWPAATRGWAAYLASVIRDPFRPLQASIEDAEIALASFEACGLAEGIACAQNRLGDTLSEQGQPGDAEKALGHYQRSLEVAERLLVANPESAQAARDVSVSLNKLADFLVSRGLPGDAEKALGHYQRSLEVRERLLVANPESAQAARDVSVSLGKLADFLARRGLAGDAEKALGHYQRSLKISERLLVANPESAQAARDVSVSLDRLGDFLASRGLAGDAEKALGHYQRSLEVAERLLLANPESAQAARDVLVSLERMAAFEGGRVGGQTKALELQRRSLGIALKLREQNPTSFFYQRTAAVSFVQTYQRAHAAGNQELAAQCLAGCFSVLDPLVRAGVELDPGMRQLHEQLKPMFGSRQA